MLSPSYERILCKFNLYLACHMRNLLGNESDFIRGIHGLLARTNCSCEQQPWAGGTAAFLFKCSTHLLCIEMEDVFRLMGIISFASISISLGFGFQTCCSSRFITIQLLHCRYFDSFTMHLKHCNMEDIRDCHSLHCNCFTGLVINLLTI